MFPRNYRSYRRYQIRRPATGRSYRARRRFKRRVGRDTVTVTMPYAGSANVVIPAGSSFNAITVFNPFRPFVAHDATRVGATALFNRSVPCGRLATLYDSVKCNWFSVECYLRDYGVVSNRYRPEMFSIVDNDFVESPADGKLLKNAIMASCLGSTSSKRTVLNPQGSNRHRVYAPAVGVQQRSVFCGISADGNLGSGVVPADGAFNPGVFVCIRLPYETPVDITFNMSYRMTASFTFRGFRYVTQDVNPIGEFELARAPVEVPGGVPEPAAAAPASVPGRSGAVDLCVGEVGGGNQITVFSSGKVFYFNGVVSRSQEQFNQFLSEAQSLRAIKVGYEEDGPYLYLMSESGKFWAVSLTEDTDGMADPPSVIAAQGVTGAVIKDNHPPSTVVDTLYMRNNSGVYYSLQMDEVDVKWDEISLVPTRSATVKLPELPEVVKEIPSSFALF